MEECGYVKVLNPDADDGLWKQGNRRQTIYGRTDLRVRPGTSSRIA
jgi:hypothetical protein